MATISFLPDRLNAEPIVFKGFTTPELFITAGLSVLGGLVVAVPFAPFIGWLAFPTVSLLMPLFTVFFGGRLMARLKRGKPENYLYRRVELWLSRQRMGDTHLIHRNQRWALRRSTPVARLRQEAFDE
ncbi:TIGR03750 family conjugal transfer protein [Yersinia enterocolitica]|uniref:TIGR03750 family conjugal transfer protein n=1 Tax=Yersinia enterocolitica TaxID=630 RepID=UPI003D02E64A